MIAPENPKTLSDIEKRIKRNLELGDWASPAKENTSSFVPVGQDEKLLQENEVNNE